MIDQGPSGVKAYAIATPAAVRQLGKWAAGDRRSGHVPDDGNREELADLAGTSTIALRGVGRAGPRSQGRQRQLADQRATAQAGLQTVHMYGTGASNGGRGSSDGPHPSQDRRAQAVLYAAALSAPR